MTEAPAFERPFVAIDGEAAGDDYVLLAASTGVSVWNRKGLDTEVCLDFLLDQNPVGGRKHHGSILVAFGLDYDVNMMLGDLPLRGPMHSIADLYLNGWTYWHGYRLRYIPRKMFGISEGEMIDGRWKSSRSVTVYDVWSFFGCSFISALESYEIEIPAIIAEGKAARGTFATWPKHRLMAYNAEECRLLVILMDKLRDALRPVVRVRSWHGPGAVAAAWLGERKAERWLRPQPEFPGRFEGAARRAYFGGRIDCSGWGEVDPVFHYDIRSAYPAAAAVLPDLSRLAWVRQGGKGLRVRADRPDLLRVRWDVRAANPAWGPLPWRSSEGAILWPQEGEGWYWSVEVAAAERRFGDRLRVIEGYVSSGRYAYPLRDDLQAAYAERARLKEKGDPAEVAHKLVLNSVYGKFAQTVGTPRFHSWEWAGLITAHARARLSDAIRIAGDQRVVLIMTDGIWTTKPLPRSALGPGLGQWAREDEVKLWLAEPGLYRAEHSDGALTDYHRGYEAAVDIPDVLARWHRKDFDPIPAAPIRFIGMGPAVVINGVYKWREWKTCERVIEPVPLVGTSKRGWYPWEDSWGAPGFVPMPPLERDEDVWSYPYEPQVMDEGLKRRLLEDECEEVPEMGVRRG